MNSTKAPAARSLRLWMKSQRLTQQALADRLGVSRQALAYWLSGDRRPEALYRHQLEAMSAGGVAVSDWLLPDEVAKVEGSRSDG